MEQTKQQSEKFIKALKRVKQIKQFYRHLKVFVIINGLLLVAKYQLIDFFAKQGIYDEGVHSWITWNAVLWGIGLFIHWVYVFQWQKLKPGFVKDWEAKQMAKFLEEENEKDPSYRK